MQVRNFSLECTFAKVCRNRNRNKGVGSVKYYPSGEISYFHATSRAITLKSPPPFRIHNFTRMPTHVLLRSSPYRRNALHKDLGGWSGK